jgi:hypothetical protein
MNINLNVKGQAICLNGATEISDLIGALEYCLGGGVGSKTFGCIQAGEPGSGRSAGTETFSSQPANGYQLTDC